MSSSLIIIMLSFVFVVPPKVIVGSCMLLYVTLTVQSYPQGYGGGGGHDEEDHVDYYVGIFYTIE